MKTVDAIFPVRRSEDVFAGAKICSYWRRSVHQREQIYAHIGLFSGMLMEEDFSKRQKDRTLVQFWRMPYNESYFNQEEGCVDELNQDAPGARAPPKRKKPTV